MELCIYQDTPPEKYYEACITYHLVCRFEQIYNRRLYPFSISQIREKRLGFDFGYELSKGNVFLVQFKRPYVKENGKIKWNVEKEQAEVLAKQPARAYYALPAFPDGKDWYKGLDKTFFVPAGSVYTWVRSKKADQSVWLGAEERMISVSDSDFNDLFGRDLKNALRQDVNYTEEDFLKQVNGAVEDEICGYWIGEMIENGAWQLL